MGRRSRIRGAPTPAARTSHRHGPVLLLSMLLLATVLAYQPAWQGEPLWDDDAHLTREELRSVDGLRRIWVDLGATQQYYPIVHSAFWLMHRLWGDDTLGYHLVNILLHALSACLLALVLRRLGISGALLAAAVFALHPVHVESVAWMTELKNTLSGFLYLAAALAYLRFDETRERRAYLVSLALFTLALLSKTVTATLPAALLVVFWWKRGVVEWRRDAVPLVPFFAIGIAAGLMTAWVERTYIGARGFEFELSVVERVLLAGRAVWFYAGTLLWPAGLSFIYPRWQIDSGEPSAYVYPLAALALLVALWLAVHRTRGPLAAVLLFGGTLVPALGFVDVFPFRYSFVADHFQYLASIPLIVLFSAGIVLAVNRTAARVPRVRQWARLAAAVFLALLAVLTWQQSRHYADAETLYRATLERNPQCWLCHNNLAALRLLDSPPDLDAAEAHVTESLRINRKNPEALNNWGFILRVRGRHEEAVQAHEESLQLAPNAAETLNNLGIALQALGRHQEALARYEHAVRLDPRLPEAHHNIGRVLQDLGRPADALPHIEEALRLRPDYSDAHDNLGNAKLRLGRHDEAIVHYRAALRLQPGDVALRRKIAAILASQGDRMLEAGRPADAIPYLEAALREPTLVEAAQLHNDLGIALAMTGKRALAAEHFRSALQLRPDLSEAQANLLRLQRER